MPHKWGGCQSDPHNHPGEYFRYCEICGQEDTCEDPLPPCIFDTLPEWRNPEEMTKHPGGRPRLPRHCPKCGKLCASAVEARACCAKRKSYRLKCATCPLWVNLGDIPEADFQRMKKIGVKCGDCVTASVIEYEEED